MNTNFLIVFRGGYTRVNDVDLVCRNILKYIIHPLQNNKYTFDIIFCTYNDDISKLNIYTEYLKPKTITFTNNGQITNFKESMSFIKDIYSTYSKIIFLRFEAIYKIPITSWNFFKENGIILPFKENTEELFLKTGWYNDIIIIITNTSYEYIYNIIINAPFEKFTPINTLHNLANIILEANNTIPIYCMVDGYFQANTGVDEQIQEHVSPLYILVHYPYYLNDFPI